MELNNNKKIIVWVIVAVVVVIILAWYFGKGGAGSQTYNGTSQNAPGGAAQTPSTTRHPVSSNIVVPSPTSSAPSGVAKPAIVTQAAPGSSSKFRSFSLTISNDKFTPNDTVMANVGDIIRLNITATDKNYDFYQPDYGLSKPLPKGIATVVEFQVSAADKYTFYCKSCGGPSKGPVGYVVVVPK